MGGTQGDGARLGWKECGEISADLAKEEEATRACVEMLTAPMRKSIRGGGPDGAAP